MQIFRRSGRVEAWGTGSASPEFIYVDDAARGIVLGVEKLDCPEPINLGVGQEITIRDLTERIVHLTGEIRWDPTKPDGQPRRDLDTSRAREQLGFDDGLRQTIAWSQPTHDRNHRNDRRLEQQ